MRWLLLALLATPLRASAQEEVCSAFSTQDLGQALNRADGELAAHQFQAAWRTTHETRKDLRCLDTLIPPLMLARLAHTLAFLTFLDQDDATAAAWARLATSLHPRSLLAVVPPPTYATFLAELPPPHVVRVDRAIAHPRRGAVFLDGFLLPEPETASETPHFVMLVDKRGKRIDAWWMDGVAFRDSLLDDRGAAPPRWAVAMSPAPLEPVAVEAQAVALEGEEEIEPGWISEAPEETWLPDCPWAGQPVQADVVRGVVTVNGRSWNADVRSQADAFLGVLRDCRADRAARRFEQYVGARRAEQPQFNLGQRDLNEVLRAVGRAGTAVAAETHRVGLIRALEDPDRLSRSR